MLLNYLLVFIFGTIIGSFLNVVIVRYDTEELSGRSHCPKCQNPLLWFELIPILSFFFLKGHCRHCGQPISMQYPIIEFLTGLVFVSVFWHYSFVMTGGLLILLSLLFFSVLIVVSAYDFYNQEIPNAVYVALAAALGMLFLNFSQFSWPLLLAGPIVALPIAIIYWLSKGRLIGFGDALLALAIGWFLGFEIGLIALLIAFWIGAIVGLFLLLIKPKKFTIKSAIPFGPFLALASFLAFIFNLNFSWLIKIFSN